MKYSLRFISLIATVLLLMGLMSPTASAGKPAPPARASAPQLVSGPDPLPGFPDPTACGSGRGMPFDRHDWESEPVIAVNPTNGANLVSAWTQDWLDGIVVGYSGDGGKTWSHVVPPTSICTPGGMAEYDKGALDAGLAFGKASSSDADGIAYLSSTVSGKDGGWAVIVNRSHDGGQTWPVDDRRKLDFVPGSHPELPGPLLHLDAPSVVADQVRPGYAYATWSRGDFTLNARRQYVSFTTDAGDTWSVPVPVPSSQIAGFGRLAVVPDRTLVPTLVPTLVAVLSEVEPPWTPSSACPLPMSMLATQSTDLGATWSPPTKIGDSDTGQSTVGVAPDGTVYVSWKKVDSSGSDFKGHSVMYAKSTDGGLSWGPPGVVGEPISGPMETATTDGRGCSHPATPNLAVTADGTVGITFYDHRRDDSSNNPAKVTDLWFRYSADKGETWQEQHVAGPFDHTQAPSTDAKPCPPEPPNCPDGTLPGNGTGFVGDYQGIAAMPGGFAAVFALAQPLPGANFSLLHPPTDIFFSRLRVGKNRSAV